MLLTLAFAVGFVALAFIATALPAAWMRKRHGVQQPIETRELARDVAARIGVLHGLILGLVFGQVMGQVNDLYSGMREEAAAAEHIYFRAGTYGAPQVQQAAQAYLDAVVAHDWPRQEREAQLSDEGWLALRKLSALTLALQPGDRGHEKLADAMQNEVFRMEHLRQLRGFEAGTHVPFGFWFAAIVGLVLIGAVFFVHEPSRKHLWIASAYSTYAGIVLFMIHDLSQPFHGLIVLQPDAFRQALAAIHSGI